MPWSVFTPFTSIQLDQLWCADTYEVRSLDEVLELLPPYIWGLYTSIRDGFSAVSHTL